MSCFRVLYICTRVASECVYYGLFLIGIAALDGMVTVWHSCEQ